MSQLVEWPLVGGGSVLVVAESDGVAEPVTRGWLERAAGAPERASETFQDAVAKVRPAAEALLETLTCMAQAPDEVTVEFAVGLSAKAGAVIANLGSSANFKVNLVWRRRDAA